MCERFIIGGRPEIIRALAETINCDPELKLISVSGPAHAPERLVATMSVQRADCFRQELGDQVVIERDQDIQPFM